MKDAYYFPHDSNAREDERCLFIISKYGPSGYGLYWMFIEKMHDQADGKLTCKLIDGLATGFKTEIETLKEFYNDAITTGLFVTDGEKYWSGRVLRNKKEFQKKKNQKSKAGKNGMKSRWNGGLNSITDDNSVITEHNKGKESKGKESKSKESNTPDSRESSDYQSIVKEYFELFKQRHQSKPVFGKSDGNIVKTLLASQPSHVILEKLRKYMRDEFWFTRDGSGRDLKKFRAHYNEIVVKIDGPTTTGSGYLSVCLGSPEARRFKFNILTENEKQVVIEKIGMAELQAEGLL